MMRQRVHAGRHSEAHLCAMITTVRPRIRRVSASCTSASLSVSSALVASAPHVQVRSTHAASVPTHQRRVRLVSSDCRMTRHIDL